MTFSPVPKPVKQEKPPRQPLRRSGRPKRVNVARRRKEFARSYGSVERVEWIKSLDCFFCASLGIPNMGPIDNVHIEGGGAGRKAHHSRIIPGCQGHHRALHRYGRAHMEMTYGVFLDICAEATEHAWQIEANRRGLTDD